MAPLFALLLVSFAAAGCFRTRYVNLAPLAARPTEELPNVDRGTPRSWQHFFVFGWAPGERVIEASDECGGVEHIRRIETRRTFVQGLIATFAGYYINIYSPYSGGVICDHTRER
jgi:hypothetical protein